MWSFCTVKASHIFQQKKNIRTQDFVCIRRPRASLEEDVGETVFQSWLTSPYFELKEKSKCIKHTENLKFWIKLLPEFRNCCKTSPSLRTLCWPLEETNSFVKDALTNRNLDDFFKLKMGNKTTILCLFEWQLNFHSLIAVATSTRLFKATLA